MKLGDYYEGYYKGYMRYLAPGTAQGYDGAVRGGTAYPVSFSATPSVTVSLEQTTGSIFATQLDAGTISSAPRVYVCSPTKQTASLAARLHVDAWGTYSVTGGHPIG